MYVVGESSFLTASGMGVGENYKQRDQRVYGKSNQVEGTTKPEGCRYLEFDCFQGTGSVTNIEINF